MKFKNSKKHIRNERIKGFEVIISKNRSIKLWICWGNLTISQEKYLAQIGAIKLVKFKHD